MPISRSFSPRPAGVRIYIYDLKSAPLPASAVSALSVEIDRPGAKTEYVTMKPDKTGTLWTGTSKPVTDPASIVRVGSVVAGESGLIELPRSKFRSMASPQRRTPCSLISAWRSRR